MTRWNGLWIMEKFIRERSYLVKRSCLSESTMEFLNLISGQVSVDSYSIPLATAFTAFVIFLKRAFYLLFLTDSVGSTNIL